MSVANKKLQRQHRKQADECMSNFLDKMPDTIQNIFDELPQIQQRIQQSSVQLLHRQVFDASTHPCHASQPEGRTQKMADSNI